eukprot:scaffold14_cov279-Pinguiococcus_pyrenoidosus.AAC.3
MAPCGPAGSRGWSKRAARPSLASIGRLLAGVTVHIHLPRRLRFHPPLRRRRRRPLCTPRRPFPFLPILVVRNATLKTAPDLSLVNVLPDDHELAAPFFVGAPRGLEVAVVEHVDGVEHIAHVHAFDGEHAFHPEDLVPTSPKHRDEEPLEVHQRDLTGRVDAPARHGGIVRAAPVQVEEVGVRLQRAIQVEGLDVEHHTHVDLGLRTALDRRDLVDGSEPRLDPLQLLLLRHKVRLVEQEAVCKGHLLHRFVYDPLGLLLIQMLHNVLGIHERDDPVQLEEVFDDLVREERLRHRAWTRHTSGLDDHRVQSLSPHNDSFAQAVKYVNQVLPDRATHAAIEQFHDLILRMLLDVVL